MKPKNNSDAGGIAEIAGALTDAVKTYVEYSKNANNQSNLGTSEV